VPARTEDVSSVSAGSGDTPDNLLPLCPNCHSLHHQDNIPTESLRAWKMLRLALNEALDRRSIELLLLLDRLKSHFVSGDGLLRFGSLIASSLVHSRIDLRPMELRSYYHDELSEKGKRFVEGRKKGDQQAALSELPPMV
jgi:hypothetical protein